jgi:hypothetical protein
MSPHTATATNLRHVAADAGAAAFAGRGRSVFRSVFRFVSIIRIIQGR